jgi:hypothetical protein
MISCIEKSLFLYRKFPQNQLGPALTIEPERDQAVALLYIEESDFLSQCDSFWCTLGWCVGPS